MIPASVEAALISSGTRARLGDLLFVEMLAPSHGAECVMRFANATLGARVFYFDDYDALTAASRELRAVQNGSFLVETDDDELRSRIAGEE